MDAFNIHYPFEAYCSCRHLGCRKVYKLGKKSIRRRARARVKRAVREEVSRI